MVVFILLMCLSSLTCVGQISRRSEHWILDNALKRLSLRDIELEILKEIEQGDLEAGILDDLDNHSEFYKPQVVKERQQNISMIDNKIASLYAKGMTTKDIRKRILEIYGAEISPTMISHKTEKVAEVAQDLQSRPLDSTYLMVVFDVICSKAKKIANEVKKDTYTCFGISKDGEKEILGIWASDEAGAKFWRGICSELKNRGLKKIFIASIDDGLKGLSEVIKEAFPGVKIQRYIIHLIRQSIKYVPHKYFKDFISDFKNVYCAPTLQTAEENVLALQKKWERRYPLAVATWVKNWDAIKTSFRFPDEVRKRIYTTNNVESLFRQFRKGIKN